MGTRVVARLLNTFLQQLITQRQTMGKASSKYENLNNYKRANWIYEWFQQDLQEHQYLNYRHSLVSPFLLNGLFYLNNLNKTANGNGNNNNNTKVSWHESALSQKGIVIKIFRALLCRTLDESNNNAAIKNKLYSLFGRRNVRNLTKLSKTLRTVDDVEKLNDLLHFNFRIGESFVLQDETILSICIELTLIGLYTNVFIAVIRELKPLNSLSIAMDTMDYITPLLKEQYRQIMNSNLRFKFQEDSYYTNPKIGEKRWWIDAYVQVVIGEDESWVSKEHKFGQVCLTRGFAETDYSPGAIYDLNYISNWDCRFGASWAYWIKRPSSSSSSSSSNAKEEDCNDSVCVKCIFLELLLSKRFQAFDSILSFLTTDENICSVMADMKNFINN